MSESLGTTIASPLAPMVAPETTSRLLFAAAANSGGVLPTPPRSMAPAFSASSSGGPDVKDFQSILWGVLPISPAAFRRAWEPPFWSPTSRVTLERSTVPSLRTASSLPEADEHAARAVAPVRTRARAAALRVRVVRRLMLLRLLSGRLAGHRGRRAPARAPRTGGVGGGCGRGAGWAPATRGRADRPRGRAPGRPASGPRPRRA